MIGSSLCAQYVCSRHVFFVAIGRRNFVVASVSIMEIPYIVRSNDRVLNTQTKIFVTRNTKMAFLMSHDSVSSLCGHSVLCCTLTNFCLRRRIFLFFFFFIFVHFEKKFKGKKMKLFFVIQLPCNYLEFDAL